MSIEPIVSSRQITYTFILRQIESRIKEVIAESIVLPFWDDTAFFSTEGKRWRGGVWVDDTMSHAGHSPEQEVAEHGDVDAVENMEENLVSRPEQLDTDPLNPVLQTKPSSSIFARKAAKSVFNNEGATKAVASSTSVDTTRSMLTDHPRVMRVGSFSGASDPTLSTDITNADTFRASSPPEHSHAAAAMAALASKSASASPTRSPIKVSGTISGRKPDSLASSSSRGSVGLDIESSHEVCLARSFSNNTATVPVVSLRSEKSLTSSSSVNPMKTRCMTTVRITHLPSPTSNVVPTVSALHRCYPRWCKTRSSHPRHLNSWTLAPPRSRPYRPDRVTPMHLQRQDALLSMQLQMPLLQPNGGD